MIFSCAIFLAKAIVGVLAAFAMIGVANSVHTKLKERIVFAGLSCLFLFVFAWLRMGAVVEFLGKMRNRAQRKHVSAWEALDLLVIGGGIAVQMFYTWRGSSSTGAGDAVEEAFTIFWLWVLYLLCSLALTPSRRRSQTVTESNADAKEVSVNERKQIYIVEQIGGRHSAAAVSALSRKLAAARELGADDLSSSAPDDGDELSLVMTCHIEQFEAALSLESASVLLSGSSFLLSTYALAMWKFVNQELSEEQWSAFCRDFGRTPAELMARELDRRSKAAGARTRVFFLISDSVVAEPSSALMILELMCVRAALLPGAMRETPMRVLHQDKVQLASKRALVGKLEHAPTLKVAQCIDATPLALSDTGMERFARMCQLCQFPRTCQSVHEALAELALVYNETYRNSL